jgi:hypothetical protein
MAWSDQRCCNHPGREAVARCPECRRTFCRECVTEHGDRVLCASCLKQWLATSKSPHPGLRRSSELLGALLGLATAWLFFYWLGQGLLTIPTSFHEGTVWRGDLLSSP